uniref:Uncharacterized protein n=1 Tax=Anopheles farauti TaxID=69004 RepID=A0A182QPG4_9DIPT
MTAADEVNCELTPTPVSCITYEVSPLATSLIAQQAPLTATSLSVPTSATSSGTSVQTIANIDELIGYSKATSIPLVTTAAGSSGLELTALPSGVNDGSSGTGNLYHHYGTSAAESDTTALVETGSVISIANRASRSSNSFGRESSSSRKLEKDSNRGACVIIHAANDGTSSSGAGVTSSSTSGNEMLSVFEAIGTGSLSGGVSYDAGVTVTSTSGGRASVVSCVSPGAEQQQQQRASGGVYRGMPKMQRVLQPASTGGTQRFLWPFP